MSQVFETVELKKDEYDRFIVEVQGLRKFKSDATDREKKLNDGELVVLKFFLFILGGLFFVVFVFKHRTITELMQWKVAAGNQDKEISRLQKECEKLTGL